MTADYSAWSREVEAGAARSERWQLLGATLRRLESSERDGEPGEGFKKQGSVCIVSKVLSGCSCQVYAGGRAGTEAEKPGKGMNRLGGVHPRAMHISG